MLCTEKILTKDFVVLHEPGQDLLNRKLQEILIYNAHKGNANVTIESEEGDQLCALFMVSGEIYGVSIAYPTQCGYIAILPELIEDFAMERERYLLEQEIAATE